MGLVRTKAVVDAPLEVVERLWFDTSRWPAFVDGFKTVVERSGDWPATHGRLVWDSNPQGRGRVVEKTIGYQPGERHESEIEDPRMRGRQLVTFSARPDGGVEVAVELDYELRGDIPKPLRGVTDALFIRRAQRDALQRTLHSFAIEAEEDATLG